VYVWAGDDPANLHFTNYQKQHLIQFFSDVQMRVAHVADAAATSLNLVVGGAAAVPGTSVAQQDTEPGSALIRYNSFANAADILVLPLKIGKVASNTSETPVSFVGWVGRERSSVELLVKDGDWYLDADAGNMVFYKSGAQANDLPTGSDTNPMANGDDIVVFDYSAGASTQEKMMHLVGDAVPGDFVTFDAKSNFKVLSPLDLSIATAAAAIVDPDYAADADADISAAIELGINNAVNTLRNAVETALEDRHFEESLVIGRVYDLIKEPRGLLERVRTGWNGSEFGADAKMPGSATKGFSDLITLSDETIADEIAIVNVKIQ